MNLRSMMKPLGLCLLLLGSMQTRAQEVHYLGNNNTLVKVHCDQRYLLLPIDEHAPEAQIDVLLGGQIVQQMNVRLALEKRDYFVPLQLDAWKGQDIVLNVRTANDRSTVRDSRSDLCWKLIKKTNDFDTRNIEPYRPAYHHTPSYGWMNDPNGMFYKDGAYHLYYQWNPYASVWANMTWGHSSSKDLIHWEHHEPALWGDALGAIFSGSAVVDHDNTAGFGKGAVVAIYTSAGQTQQQSLAYSTDNGMTFTKYPGNPIIMSDKETRDDNFFWDEEHQQWALVLADALTRQDLFFTSKDLKNWTRTGEFGQGYGCQDGVWECPDLMQLSTKNGKTKRWVLIVNINPGNPFGGSGIQYFVGNYDGKTFTCDDAKNVTRWLDYGKDNYAAVSWSNAPEDRKTIIGWMSNWQYANVVPTMQYRSANTLPRELWLEKDEEGKMYVAQSVSPEVLEAFEPADAISNECMVQITLKLNKKGTNNITLSNSKGEKVVMTYDATRHTFSMDRKQSGVVEFSADFPAVTVAPISKDRTQTLQLFIDHSSIEALDKNGRWAMTNLVFPTTPYDKLEVEGGKVEIFKLKK